ncbi:unnamed protein product [Lasius platythorax]|uniref:Uncharacterized protein n=1 Tax=Lasius platythorax TaxID=488582 RepID=A0AAV2NQS0_9HYME
MEKERASESPFRQGSFLPKKFSKKSSRQTVTRERVAGSWSEKKGRRETWSENEGGKKKKRRSYVINIRSVRNL